MDIRTLTWLFVPLALGASSTGAGRAAGEGPLSSSAWMASAREAIERAEYEFDAVEAGAVSAPNRAQGLRARVDGAGLTVRAREARPGDGGWRLGLRTRAIGRLGFEAPAGEGELAHRGGRAELRRGAPDATPFTEWFENGPRGIEQGWTVHAAPPGPAERPLAIELALEGFEASVEEGARSAVFAELSGATRLRYAGLRAWDAEGTELSAALEPLPGGLRVRVELGAARFPVTVDPILEGPTWSFAGNQSSANLGYSVAGGGDFDGDGYDDVLVGANLFDGGHLNEGRVFLFLGSPSGPSATPSWTADSNQSGAQMGVSVASAGDVNGDGYDDVIAGSHEWDETALGEGRAWLFHGSPTGPSTTADWTYFGGATIVALGYAVASAGDVNGDGYDDVILSAPFWHEPVGDEGAALVFHGSASGLSATPDWLVEGEQETAVLGRAVAGAGDVNGDGYDDVVVGAYYFDDGEHDEGVAYVFHGSASGLSTVPDWLTWGDQEDAWMGQAADGAGDVNGDGYDDLIVAAPGYSSSPSTEGRAQLHLGSPSGLSPAPDWIVDGPKDSGFSFAVAGVGDLNGDGFADVCVGSYGYDGALTDQGRVEVFLGSSAGLAAAPHWRGEGNQASSFFGYSVAGAGDVDGDGYDDLIVGAVLQDAQYVNEGAAYLFRGLPFCDCNGNGLDDLEDIEAGVSADCNGNGVPDECDIAEGTSEDADMDGTPDECECAVQAYCLTAPNSVDPVGARIRFTGSASVPADDLVLTAGPCPPGQSAVFYFGPNALQLPFGNGWRCVGGSPIHRLPVVSTGAGTASFAVDYGLEPMNALVPGSRWRFQCWYRDPAGGGANFNLSDALAIDFCF